MTVLWATTPERRDVQHDGVDDQERARSGRPRRTPIPSLRHGGTEVSPGLDRDHRPGSVRGSPRPCPNLEPSEAVKELRAALELVRGQPFADTRGYEWAYSEGLVANIEVTVADAAHQLSALYLDVGDSAGATWAAERGLKAAPGDEILYRDRMLACDLAGNPAGVEAVMKELCEVVETSRSLRLRSIPRRSRCTSDSAVAGDGSGPLDVCRRPSTPALFAWQSRHLVVLRRIG